MDDQLFDKLALNDLRARAADRLTGTQDLACVASRAADALAALHALATSPSTATDALALLHELQVHQVELDLQAEELRDSRVELETALRRQAELHDFQPAACFVVDARLVIRETNWRGAQMLGLARDAVPGLPLDSFFNTESAQALRASVTATATPVDRPLTWQRPGTAPPTVHAAIAADPSGSGFLVALLGT